MATWFRVDFSLDIESFDVMKATEKTLMYVHPMWPAKVQRTLKTTEYHNWFETRNEAVEFARAKLERKVHFHDDQLKAALKKLAELK